MADTKRTLDVEMRFVDRFLSPFQRTARGFANLIRTGFLNPLRTLGRHLLSFKSLLLSSFAGFTAFAGARQLSALVDSADALSKMARSLNVTTEAMSSLQFAFELSGASAEQFTTIMRSLQTAIGGANRNPVGQQAEAFQRLGISLDFLRQHGNDSIEVFRQLREGIDGLNAAEAVTLVQSLFPESFSTVLQLIGQSEEGFEAMLEQAEKFGFVLRAEIGVEAEKLNDSFTRLGKITEAISLEAFLSDPTFRAGIDALTNFLSEKRVFFAETLRKSMLALVDVFLVLAKFVISIIQSLPKLIDLLAELPIIGKAIKESLGSALSGDDKGILGGATEELTRGLAALGDVIDTFRNADFSDLIDTGDLVTQFGDAQEAAGSFFDEVDDFDWPKIGAEVDQFFSQFFDLNAAAVNAVQDLTGTVTGGLSEALTESILDINNASEAFANFGKVALRALLGIITQLLTIIALRLVLKAIPGLGALAFTGGGVAGGVAAASGGFGAIGGGGTGVGFRGAAAGGGAAGGFSRSGGGLFGAGQAAGITVNYSIQALDSRDVRRMLIDQGDTITDIATGGLASSAAFRGAIRRIR